MPAQLACLVAGSVLAASALAGPAAPAGATSRAHGTSVRAHNIAPSVTWPLASWQTSLPGSVTQSSPTVATVAGTTVVAVGDESGVVSLVNAATGAPMPGWPEHVAVPHGGTAPIESSPTIAYLDGPRRPPSIIVGTGSTWVKGTVGEVEAFTFKGHARFVYHVGNAGHGTAVGVISSPAVGSLDGSATQDIVFGSWDHNVYALTPSGKVLPGFPFNNGDTIWSSPALYRLPGTKGDTIFLGSDASGLPYHVGAKLLHCWGGFVGAYTYQHQTVVPRWRDCEPQSVWSSPAVGILTSASTPVVIVGTSFYYQPFPAETNELLGFDALTGAPLPGWPVKTRGPVLGSPAIGDLAPGIRGVVDTTWSCTGGTPAACPGHSRVDAWSAHGRQLWSDMLPGPESFGSPILVPLTNAASNDVLVGSPNNGLFPLAGKTGAPMYGTSLTNQYATINPGCRIFNTPAVAYVAGTGPKSGWHVFEACGGPPVFSLHGSLVSYRLKNDPTITPAWPMFHANAQHDGVALTPSQSLQSPVLSGAAPASSLVTGTTSSIPATQ
ncbi:MAG: hypothetical protein JWM85_2581 [Acidimicrobiaceae bacterium]|nr:hypothetical protein [Acidimicrobiaceae bacterium]